MPRLEEVLTIFLASPSDLSEERNRLADVVKTWNHTWSRHLSLRLELIRWEDDAYPAVGIDAQDVVNRQLPTDYDLFIGLMWSRFGTPTGRAGSGTEEEFDRALARHKANPGEIDILFYFKDAPIAPSKMDPEQLGRIQKFRRSLSDTGMLTWEFSDADQFESIVTVHITKHVQAWRQSHDRKEAPSLRNVDPSRPAEVVGSLSQDETDEDSGYLDLIDTFTEHSRQLNEITNRISAAQNELTEQTLKGTAELDAMNASGETPSQAKLRGSISNVANAMMKFTRKVEVEIPVFRIAMDASMSALIKSATLGAELDPEQTKLTRAAAAQLLSSMIDARQSTVGFRNTTANLPRMTKELNIAKRLEVAVLDKFIGELENAERLLTEGLGVIDELVPK
ncbi:MAG: DUF4062 domain-containing protein [Burkholderiaceae bacterium]|nr:DUF4062 domain-containing protein [Burkholderiaceae bacterium]